MANGEVTTGKVIALIRALSTSSTSSATYTVTDALILGAATTSGVRLDLESGTLAVREGDDSAYAPLRVLELLGYSGVGNHLHLNGSGVDVGSAIPIRWSSSTAVGSLDTGLARDSAGQVKVTDGSTGVGNLRATALIVGTADTSGVRLDLESGALAVREGDDSAYAPLKTGLVTASGLGESVSSRFFLTGTRLGIGSAGDVAWASGATAPGGGGTADTGLARDAAAQVVVTDGSTGVGNLRATALIVGTADTSGVRLDLESGVLAVREGDDSAYAPLRVFSLGVGATPSASLGDINCTQITASSWINGAGTGAFLGPLLYQGSYTSSQSVSHASSGRVIHNASASGDIEITLPAMASKGSFFVVFVGSANYLKITANVADKIRNGAAASASGGYIRSNVIGSTMLLVGTGTTDWSVIGPTGTWTIDS